ncbi:MAG: DUF502 domain-containing protein [Candidatus Latescibacterota bacterium]|nr:DUF502 domain-containing protein [Candidatus Latescibacterota bacterium]
MSDENVEIIDDEKLAGASFEESPPGPSRRHRFRTVMMAGLTVITPMWITGMVLWWLFNQADRISRPLLRPFAAMLGDPDFYVRGIGFLITLFIIYAVGMVTTHVLGRRLVQDAREALERLPVFRTIYSPVRKLMETMASPDKPGFKKVVLFEYPRKGTWTLGFLAGDVPREGGGQPAHSIFVPTAPNPTTGFMLIVPRQEVRLTELSPEAAFQMIVSAGVAVPSTLTLPADVAAAEGDGITTVQIADVEMARVTCPEKSPS